MNGLEEILLPVDFSPRCVETGRYAAALAGHFHSTITLLHVLLPFNPAWAAFGGGPGLDEILAHDREQARDRLDVFLEEELGDFEVKRVLVEGDPAEAINCLARSEKPGLIMMPTRGCGRFRRFILGSVTTKVLHDVSCPVWTTAHVANGCVAAPGLPKVIVCAADLTPTGEAVLHWASEFTAEIQARLIVAHAIPSLEFHPATYFLEADMRKALIRERHTKLAKALESSATPGADVRVEGGSVQSVIRSIAEDNRADLLIIGRGSNGGMLGRLRTHSYALIRESPCPVISI